MLSAFSRNASCLCAITSLRSTPITLISFDPPNNFKQKQGGYYYTCFTDKENEWLAQGHRAKTSQSLQTLYSISFLWLYDASAFSRLWPIHLRKYRTSAEHPHLNSFFCLCIIQSIVLVYKFIVNSLPARQHMSKGSTKRIFNRIYIYLGEPQRRLEILTVTCSGANHILKK